MTGGGWRTTNLEFPAVYSTMTDEEDDYPEVAIPHEKGYVTLSLKSDRRSVLAISLSRACVRPVTEV
jgi:hypothetical protein